MPCLTVTLCPGEGGTFALFQGLYPPEDKDFDADRTLTGDSYKLAPKSTNKLSPKFRWPLLLWVRRLQFLWLAFSDAVFQSLFGTSLTLADGVFTPAVSVTSAVGGIAVATPKVASDITPISIVSQTSALLQ